MLSLLASTQSFLATPSVRMASGAAPAINMAGGWDIQEVSPDGALVQRVEGMTRKTWQFNDISKDRVQVAPPARAARSTPTSSSGLAPTGRPSR